MSVNKCIIVGHLGKDPELRYTPSGAAVATFSVATTEKFKGKDGQQQEVTTWHNIVIWNKLAEIAAKYLKKGSQVYLEGKIQNRSYDDRDGNKRYIAEIVCNEMRMLGGGNREATGNSGSAGKTTPDPHNNSSYDSHEEPPFDPDDEVPF